MKVICNQCKEEGIIDGYDNYNFSIPGCGSCMIKAGKVIITPFELVGKRLIVDHLFVCPACEFNQIMAGFKFCPGCGRELIFNLHVFESLRKEILDGLR